MYDFLVDIWKFAILAGIALLIFYWGFKEGEESTRVLPQDDDPPMTPKDPQLGEGWDEFVSLVAQVDTLEARCAKVWNDSLEERRRYRELRRTDPRAAREFIRNAQQESAVDETLLPDIDRFFDALCSLYLGAEDEFRCEIRTLLERNKRLLGNLRSYAARAGNKLEQTGNPEFLLRGLAAASIDEGRSCQDYGAVLGELYGKAINHGLEPHTFFSVVAKKSDSEMRSTLENFESSSDFDTFVRPYIRDRKT